MPDPRLIYERTNVVKVLVVNPENEILLIQEPPINEWMPGRWGLPGGRPLEKEALKDAFHRKVQEEIGVSLSPTGLHRIEELLIEGKTVLMFVVVAEVEGRFDPTNPKVESRWVTKEEVEKMQTQEFTEYYNRDLLLNFLSGHRKTIDLDIIDTHSYYLFSADSEYLRWWEGREK